MPDGGLIAGCDHSLVLKAGTKQAAEPSVFIDVPRWVDGLCVTKTSGPRFRCLVRNGYLPTGQLYLGVAPGEMSGPFLQGIADRWAAESDQREGICFSQYTGNGERVIVIPIISEVPGQKYVQMVVAAAFFLRYSPEARHDDLVGEFLYEVVFGGGGGDSTAAEDDVSAPAGRAPRGKDLSVDPGSEGGTPLRPACADVSILTTASVDTPRPTPLFLSAPSSNPARGPVVFRLGLPRSGRVAVVVHDVSGRAVRTLADGEWPAGVASVGWDLRDRSGAPVAHGTYFVRLISELGVRVTRIAVVR